MEEKGKEINVLTESCQCCLSRENLRSMTEPFIIGNEIELYCDMLKKCFVTIMEGEEMSDLNLFICDECVAKLRACYIFRKQVEKSQELLYNNDKVIILNQENVDVYLQNGTDLPGLIKEEFMTDISNDELLWNGLKSNTKEVSQSACLDRNLPHIQHDVQPTLLDRQIKTALTKLKTSQIFDELGESIESNSESRGLCVKVVALNSITPSDTKKLHEKIKHLLARTTKLKTNTNQTNIVQTCQRQIVAKEECKSKGRTQSKKNRGDRKPYQISGSDNRCGVCNEDFHSYQSLVAHMNGHYPQFICDKCGKGFAVRSALRAHIQIHNEGIPCKICSKKIMKRNLAKHVNAHLGKKDIHRCPLCDQRFEKFSSRAEHMEKEHNIVKRYKCKWCGKVFNLTANLNLHIRDQHNPFVKMQIKSNKLTRKPRTSNFECETCGKTFRQKLHLEHHQISKHSNEKNYQCNICLRSYFLKYTLNQHMKDYHGEEGRHFCLVCNKVFKVKRMVTRHLKRVHNKLDTTPESNYLPTANPD